MRLVSTPNAPTSTQNRRRESTALIDLFYAHIAGMDALARGLRNAAALLEAGDLTKLLEERYASWGAKGGIGKKIRAGKVRWLAVVSGVGDAGGGGDGDGGDGGDAAWLDGAIERGGVRVGGVG